MLTLRHIAIGIAAIAGLSAPGVAQIGPGGGGPGGSTQPLPGSGNAVEMAKGSTEENASYNRVISRVGVRPGEKAKAAPSKGPVPASAADVVAGAPVRDAKGVALGQVESVDGDSAVLVFGTGKIRYPLVGFGKDAQGLLIDLTTKDFLALVAKATAGS